MVECMVGIAANYLQLQLFWDGVSCATQPVKPYPVARWGVIACPAILYLKQLEYLNLAHISVWPTNKF